MNRKKLSFLCLRARALQRAGVKGGIQINYSQRRLKFAGSVILNQVLNLIQDLRFEDLVLRTNQDAEINQA
jgi:citrate lyase alpha subunit